MKFKIFKTLLTFVGGILTALIGAYATLKSPAININFQGLTNTVNKDEVNQIK